MDVLLVVDMQVGLAPASGPFAAICGRKGDNFEPHTPGWAFLPELVRDPADMVVSKELNDPFAGTDLQARLSEMAPDRILITGWATDLCVDATVRSAVSNHHNVVVVADGHTLNDRPHLDAASVIRHHHWVWSDLITQRSIRLASANELLA